MTNQAQIPIGSKITTRHEWPGLMGPDGRVYGHLPAGITGEVFGHTEDGRAQIVFYDQIHTFDNLDEMIVEPPATEQIGLMVVQPVWTQKDINRILNELTEKRRHGYELREEIVALNQKIKEFQAKLHDLHDKYVAAQDELHGLRIKTKWKPVAVDETVDCECRACHASIIPTNEGVMVMDDYDRRKGVVVLLPDDVRLCRRS